MKKLKTNCFLKSKDTLGWKGQKGSNTANQMCLDHFARIHYLNVYMLASNFLASKGIYFQQRHLFSIQPLKTSFKEYLISKSRVGSFLFIITRVLTATFGLPCHAFCCPCFTNVQAQSGHNLSEIKTWHISKTFHISYFYFLYPLKHFN